MHVVIETSKKKKTMVMFVKLSEYTKHNVHFKWVNFRARKFYVNKTVGKKIVHRSLTKASLVSFWRFLISLFLLQVILYSLSTPSNPFQ